MSTERARKRAVEELNLQNLTDDEAVRLLDLANESVYDTDCIPADGATSSKRWRRTSLVMSPSPGGHREREVKEAFRATVAHTFRDCGVGRRRVSALSSSVETTLDVCPNHDPGTGTLCPACDRSHMAEVWLVCTTCKRSTFPPVSGVVLDHPSVTAFYHEHGIEYRFTSWETVVRSFDVREELLSEDSLEMRFTIPAGDDALRLTLDDGLNVIDVSQ